MKRRSLVRVAGAAIAVGALLATSHAVAQAWPSKAVRIVVPFGAGGGTDIQGRLLGKKFQESMKQNFLVDNRPGAAGLIGAELIARSPGDGYNILFTTASLAVNITLYGKRVKFDPYTDLVPVSWISSVPLVLVVHPSVPAKNVNELIALAKKTGKLNAGHNGSGTTSHLSVEMLRQYAKVDVTPIPYKGGGPAIAALSGACFSEIIFAAPAVS